MKWQSKSEKRIFWLVIGCFMLFLVLLLAYLVYHLQNGVEAEIPYGGGRMEGFEINTETVAWEDGLYGVGAGKSKLLGVGIEEEKVQAEYLALDFLENNQEDENAQYGNYVLNLSSAVAAGDYEYLYSQLSQEALENLHTSYTVDTLREWMEEQRVSAGENAVLIYHETMDCGDYALCLASFVAYHGGHGNILYDYQDAVDITLTVYGEGNEMRYLPFDVSEYGVVSLFGTGRQQFYLDYLESLDAQTDENVQESEEDNGTDVE